MSSKDLHPSVKEFKQFISKRPKLIKHVREQGGSWQTYYEKWTLLGEEDSYWEQFKEGSEVKAESKSKNAENDTNDTEGSKDTNQKEFMGQVMDVIEKVDLNKVQAHISQLNGAIQNIQSLVGQFQQMKKQVPAKGESSVPKSPFHFGKD